MKTDFEVLPDFLAIEKHLLHVVNDFGQSGRLLHRARNEVRVMVVGGERVAVKSYVKITWANRLIYGVLRKSKAQRAYENALILLRSGVPTPKPVAYVDRYKGPFLTNSYFVCLYVNYKPCRELFDRPLEECRNALGNFGRFLYRLHSMGIFHGDLNLNNVLYFERAGQYEFCLIDNNRIRLRNYTKPRGARNLRRIKLPLDKWALMAMEYAAAGQTDVYETALGILYFRHAGKVLGGVKRAVKGWRSLLLGKIKAA